MNMDRLKSDTDELIALSDWASQKSRERAAAAGLDEDEAVKAFLPGVYQHYKGGRYTALGLFRHHETRRVYVAYVSHTHGTANLRPLRIDGEDSWIDWVNPVDGTVVSADRAGSVRRFVRIQEQPK